MTYGALAMIFSKLSVSDETHKLSSYFLRFTDSKRQCAQSEKFELDRNRIYIYNAQIIIKFSEIP